VATAPQAGDGGHVPRNRRGGPGAKGVCQRALNGPIAAGTAAPAAGRARCVNGEERVARRQHGGGRAGRRSTSSAAAKSTIVRGAPTAAPSTGAAAASTGSPHTTHPVRPEKSPPSPLPSSRAFAAIRPHRPRLRPPPRHQHRSGHSPPHSPSLPPLPAQGVSSSRPPSWAADT